MVLECNNERTTRLGYLCKNKGEGGAALEQVKGSSTLFFLTPVDPKIGLLGRLHLASEN